LVFVTETSLDLVAVLCSHWAVWKRDITVGKWWQIFTDETKSLKDEVLIFSGASLYGRRLQASLSEA